MADVPEGLFCNLLPSHSGDFILATDNEGNRSWAVRASKVNELDNMKINGEIFRGFYYIHLSGLLLATSLRWERLGGNNSEMFCSNLSLWDTNFSYLYFQNPH